MATLDGKRALITAGAGGIGLSIAKAFAEAGAKVHGCDIDEAGLRDLKALLPGIGTTVCDIADRGSVQRMMVEATAALGGLDVLVNNAGIAGPAASVEDMDPEAWEAMLRVNLTGTSLLHDEVGAHRFHKDLGGRSAPAAGLRGPCFKERSHGGARRVQRVGKPVDKRFVDPSDIAALAVFFASKAGRSISGQMIPIDGDSQSAC